MLWFINLSDCRYSPYSIHFPEFIPIFFSRENGKKKTDTKIVRHFYDKVMPTVTRRAKH